MTLPQVAASPAEIPRPLTATSPEQLPTPCCFLPPQTGLRELTPVSKQHSAAGGNSAHQADGRHFQLMTTILKEAVRALSQSDWLSHLALLFQPSVPLLKLPRLLLALHF